jgi:AcrR family transcriptional regulator
MATDEEKLRRLPSGRHGLSREFVRRNQRERLIAGTIAAVAEHGFSDASVGRISAAAGVSRQTFYDYFSTKEECFLATYDLFESHALKTLREAGDGRGWSATVGARVDALLEMLEGNPDLVRLSLTAPAASGVELRERRRRFLENLIERLAADAPKSTPRRPSQIELEAMAGGLTSLLIARVAERAEPELSDLGPELIELVLAPYLGRERAAEQAHDERRP